jgi:uncharacterized membrane protein
MAALRFVHCSMAAWRRRRHKNDANQKRRCVKGLAGNPENAQAGWEKSLASYSTRVRRDIARWVGQGLITPSVGDQLARDVGANERKSLSFGSILAMMAALLFAAAILLLVATNWEAIPRLARVGMLFAVILAGFLGGAVLTTRDHRAIGEALYIVAAAAFGASIALVGQMYHLTGDEASAIITWSVGTGVAAVALRSAPLTIAGVGIAASWLVLWGMDFLGDRTFPYYYIVLAALFWMASYWTRSAGARHLILLSVIFYAALMVTRHDTVPLTLASALLFAASVFAPGPVERIVQLDGRFPIHCLIGFLVGVFMLQIEVIEETADFALLAAIMFAGIAAAVVLAGRESRGLRWIAYLGFSAELAFVYVATLGTMLGTAGLFFASGIVLGLVALVIIRIEKRMRATPAIEGAA